MTPEEKIIKLLELDSLLNSNTITKEEFELLKTNLINSKPIQNNATYKGKHILWVILILTVVFFLYIVIINNSGNFDSKSKSLMGLLNYNYTGKNNSVESNEKKIEEDNNSIDFAQKNTEKQEKDIKEIKLTLLDEFRDKMILYLDKPDFTGYLTEEKNFAVYYDKVTENGKLKNLVVFLSFNRIAQINAVDYDDRVYGGIHYIIVERDRLKSNAADFTYENKAGQEFKD